MVITAPGKRGWLSETDFKQEYLDSRVKTQHGWGTGFHTAAPFCLSTPTPCRREGQDHRAEERAGLPLSCKDSSLSLGMLLLGWSYSWSPRKCRNHSLNMHYSMMWPIHSYKPFNYEHIYLSVSIKRYINVYSLPHKMIPAFGSPTTDTCGKCPCSLLRCPSQHQAADTPGQAHLNLLEAVFFSIQVLVVFSKI